MITPTDKQNIAIKAVIDWYISPNSPQEFYFAGFAGVGKSSLLEIIIQELRDKHKLKRVRNAAFTGKAALVMRKKGIGNAQTIHSLIYKAKIDKQTGHVTWKISNDSDAADADLIVLDDCSMVDQKMADDLRSFDKKILIMGDPGQLPPVKGAGAFTNRTPDVFLTEIHRQAADSPILELATMAREGKAIPVGYNRGNVSVQALTKESQELVYRTDTQPICGLNRVRWVYSQRIRKRLGFEGELPIVGERLICCKNNAQEGFFNGSLGELKKFSVRPASDIEQETFEIDVQIEDEPHPSENLIVDPYMFNNHFTGGASKKAEWYKGRPRYEEFDWGYVLTCHKAQGSSWNNVTVVNDADTFKQDAHKWLYTAITRAEESLTILMRE